MLVGENSWKKLGTGWKQHFKNLSILTALCWKLKAMLKHCHGDRGLRILKMLNFDEEKDTIDTHNLMVLLFIYVSKQAYDFF